MGLSNIMSAIYPTTYQTTRVSRTSTIPSQLICTKPTNKTMRNANRSVVMTAVVPRKADMHKLDNAKPEFELLDSKQRRSNAHADAFVFGSMVHNGLVHRQSYLVRSYEVGADQTASIETFMNHLQESALSHGKLIGLQNDGFGSTPEMTKRNLIWVFSKIQLIVDRYPSWGDIVEVDTWLAPHGKFGTRREWHVRDHHSGQTIFRATSLLVMMNKLTRKLAKIPNEVRREWEPYFIDRMPIINEDEITLSNQEKLSDRNSVEKHLIKGLTPKWGDLDLNQHVNNVKYIGWILESAPMDIPENQELAGITLEYKRECGRNNVVQSLTTVYSNSPDSVQPNSASSIHCDHLISLESGATIVKACSTWRPKRAPALAI